MLIPTKSAPLATIVRDANWLPHRYDPDHDAVHFLPVSRAMHRAATFITDEHLPPGLDPTILRRTEAMGSVPAAAPLHFVFHSAFCCSTMLARAFDRPGWAMGLKEPVILNDIIGWRRRGGRGPDMASVLDDALTLLARPFGTGEAVIVKPSNAVHGLAAAMLALRPDSRAVLLYAPLRTYLASVAKKGMDGRLWVRVLLLGLIDDKLIDLGFTPRDYLGLSDLQVAAVGWLAQHMLFLAMIERFGAGRVRTLDSETLTTRPADTMRALSKLFRLPLSDAALQAIVAGPAFTRHSKLDAAFDMSARAQEDRAAQAMHADEIEKVAQWTEAVARTFKVPMGSPATLDTR
ncbi:hypothetical protein ACFSAA_09210 [Sphingomonas qilianensis]